MAIPNPWQPGMANRTQHTHLQPLATRHVVRALQHMFSSHLTLFSSLHGCIKQCQEDFDITQIYQLNLENVQLKVLRFLSHKGVTIMTMRKVASMALHDTWHNCLAEAREHKPCSAMPQGKQSACGWMLLQRKVLCSASSSEHSCC